MDIKQQLTNIQESEKTPLVKWLLEIVKQQDHYIQFLHKQNDDLQKQNIELQDRVSNLEKELRQIKKLKEKPNIKPSTLNKNDKDKNKEGDKRPGSDKRSKKDIIIHEERSLEPDNLPKGAVFVREREFDVQEIAFGNHNIRFKIREYRLPDGTIVSGKLPQEFDSHFGPTMQTFINYQHYQCGVPQHLILEQMREWNVDISEGQINRILTEKSADFQSESERLLQVGLKHSSYIHTDDTGARHAGKNASCNVIGNAFFTYFYTSDSKSRENFLKILRGSAGNYLLNDNAKVYLEELYGPEAQKFINRIPFSETLFFNTEEELDKKLVELGFKNKNILKDVRESAIFASAVEAGLRSDMVLLSDGAPQFKILCHALCWIHAERLLRKLSSENEEQVANVEKVRGLIWDYYQKLKSYKENPEQASATELEKEFDEIFSMRFEGHKALNDALSRLHESRSQLLLVLSHPFVPLHNNGAEGDIREYVTRRKRSGGTRSEAGKKTLDNMLGLKKTCRKMVISFWAYLSDRLHNAQKILGLDKLLKDKLESVTVN